MKNPLNIDSVWTRQIENGQQPSGDDLKKHLKQVHDNNAGFTEALAWKCRDDNGKNSYELLADVIDRKFHSNVLDLACGSGVLLDLCHRRYGDDLELTGVDMNDSELKLARERLSHTDIKLNNSMAQNLNFVSDLSIDIILCHWALTLMDPVIPVFDSAKRVLRESGIFAAIVDGDSDMAPGYSEINNIIFKHVCQEHPNYGRIELGDPRVRSVEGIHELATTTFNDSKITITPSILNFNAPANILAQEVAGFFYASFVLTEERHRKMIIDLESYFLSHLKDGLSCFYMPINLLVIKKGT